MDSGKRACDRLSKSGVGEILESLERESYPWLAAGLAVGLFCHALFFVLYPPRPRTERTVTRHPPITLIVRTPREKDPLLVPPPERSEHYRYRPSFSPAVPSTRRRGDMPVFDTDTPPETVKDITYDALAPNEVMHDSLRDIERSGRESELIPPLYERLVTDTGRYPVELLISPTNKRAIQGYADLVYVWSERYDPPDSLHHPVIDLAAAVDRYTNIDARAVLELDAEYSHMIPNYPFVYVTTDTFMKLRHPKRFFTRENMFYVIVNTSGDNDEDVQREVVSRLQSLYPVTLRLGVLPLDIQHPLFHSFYDFTEKPEGFGTILSFWFRHRIPVGLYIPFDIGRYLNTESSNEYMQFAINMAVYALAPSTWFDGDRRLSYSNALNNDYTEWHESGQMRFSFTRYTGTVHYPLFNDSYPSVLWLPKRPCEMHRIVSYDIAVPNIKEALRYYLFDYNGLFAEKAKIFHVYDEDPYDGKKSILWGVYDSYDGWHENGADMYHYRYNQRLFVEYDENGELLFDSEGQESMGE